MTAEAGSSRTEGATAPTSDTGRAEGISFGGVAESYDRGRPGYPRAAAEWLLNGPAGQASVVLELGAGTGKLTAHLVEVAPDVLATDPDEQMLALLARNVPKARTATGQAEEINLPDRSVDVIVAAQALHWFDLDRAIPEMGRVLRSYGSVGLVWNERDISIPWVRKLNALLGTQDHEFDVVGFLAEHPAMEVIEREEFRHWQSLNRQQLTEFVNSRSETMAQSPEDRAERVAKVTALYDEYDRGGGLQLPWIAKCYRARIDLDLSASHDSGEDTSPLDPPRHDPDSDDDGTLLFEFK